MADSMNMSAGAGKLFARGMAKHLTTIKQEIGEANINEIKEILVGKFNYYFDAERRNRTDD